MYKRAWDEQVAPRYRAGEPAPGMSRVRFLWLLNAAEYLAGAHLLSTTIPAGRRLVHRKRDINATSKEIASRIASTREKSTIVYETLTISEV